MLTFLKISVAICLVACVLCALAMLADLLTGRYLFALTMFLLSSLDVGLMFVNLFLLDIHQDIERNRRV